MAEHTDPATQARTLADELDNNKREIRSFILFAETVCKFPVPEILRAAAAEIERLRHDYVADLKAQRADLEKETEELEAEAERLQAFKDWVHNYLDTHGVPYHPPGPHGAEGCRIGDRMDWLMAELARLRAERDEAVAAEREACLKLAEDQICVTPEGKAVRSWIVAAIRKRWEGKPCPAS